MSDNVTYVNFKPSTVMLINEDGTQIPVCICSCGNYSFWIGETGIIVCCECKSECKLVNQKLNL